MTSAADSYLSHLTDEQIAADLVRRSKPWRVEPCPNGRKVQIISAAASGAYKLAYFGNREFADEAARAVNLEGELEAAIRDLLPYATAAIGLPRNAWPADSVILKAERLLAQIEAARPKFCRNAEPGTFNHECGRPASWIGAHASGQEQPFCDGCRTDGHEARRVVSWRRIDGRAGA